MLGFDWLALSCRVWVCSVPQIGSRIFVELPYIQQYLQGDCARSWVKDSMETWQARLAPLGLPAQRLRPSFLSVRRRLGREGESVPHRHMLGGAREATCGIVTLLMILCGTLRSHGKRSKVESDQARQLLFIIVDFFFGGCTSCVSVHSDVAATDARRRPPALVVTKGFLASDGVARATSAASACAMAAATRRLCPSAAEGCVHLSVLIETLSQKIFSPKCAPRLKQQWVCSVECVAFHVGVQCKSARFQTDKDHELPILMAKSRPRRIPTTLKRQIADGSRSVLGRKATSQQLMRARKFWGGGAAHNKDRRSLSVKTLDTAIMYQYMWAAREMLSKEHIVCVATDGLRVSNEETLQTVVYAPGRRMLLVTSAGDSGLRRHSRKGHNLLLHCCDRPGPSIPATPARHLWTSGAFRCGFCRLPHAVA